MRKKDEHVLCTCIQDYTYFLLLNVYNHANYFAKDCPYIFYLNYFILFLLNVLFYFIQNDSCAVKGSIVPLAQIK